MAHGALAQKMSADFIMDEPPSSADVEDPGFIAKTVEYHHCT